MRRFTGPLTLAAALLLAALPAPAQEFEPGLIIDLHVNAERENVSMGGSVPEGGKFRLTREGGATYAFSPRRAGRSQRDFVVTVLRGHGDDPKTMRFEPIETLRASLGVPVQVKSLPMVTLVIDGTRRPTAAAEPVRAEFASYARRIARGAFADDFCCVSCDGWIACACGVRMSCGSCCVGECCLKPSTSLPDLPGRGSFASFTGKACRPVPDAERVFTRPNAAPEVVVSSR